MIPRVEKTTFLGVCIDSLLSWKPHIHEVENKIAKNIGIINRLHFLFPKNVLRSLYCSLVLPYLTYCSLVWGSTYPSNVEKLSILQKKIIRIVSDVPFRSHTDPLFHDLKLLKFKDVVTYQQCIFMYECMRNLLPDYFCHMFNLNSEIHSYPTRSRKNVRITTHRTVSFQQNIRFTGPKLWNELSDTLKNCQSVNTFKRNLKQSLLAKNL